MLRLVLERVKSVLWWEPKITTRTSGGNCFKAVMTLTTSAFHSWVHSCGL